MILSKKRADLKEILDKIAEAFKTNRPIEGEVLCQVKGGLIANVGIQGFIPVSHIRKEAVRNLDSYIGKRIKAKVLEFNRKKREVVLSIKAAEEEERKRKREEFLNNVVEGQIRKGRITKLTKFGAFVNLGEMDGLIPLSELSWRRIKHPRDVVKVGDKVNAVVIKVDRANGKISLSLKEAQTSPWEKIEERISVGSIVDGKITKVTPYYTFVEVDGEVEGLLPNREILPSVILKEGQRVKVKVIGLESKQKRLILSLKKAEEEREREEIEAYLGQPGKGGIKLGEVLQGKV
jgi:4-hydroxy-3-methylbut-2-enyl diphosphate reductase